MLRVWHGRKYIEILSQSIWKIMWRILKLVHVSICANQTQKQNSDIQNTIYLFTSFKININIQIKNRKHEIFSYPKHNLFIYFYYIVQKSTINVFLIKQRIVFVVFFFFVGFFTFVLCFCVFFV